MNPRSLFIPAVLLLSLACNGTEKKEGGPDGGKEWNPKNGSNPANSNKTPENGGKNNGTPIKGSSSQNNTVSDESVVVERNSKRPTWTDQSTYVSGENFIGVGTGQDVNQKAARDRAINRATAELARLKEVRIKSIAQTYAETHTEDDYQALYEQTREIINAESSQRLRFTSVMGEPYIEKISGAIVYYIRVSIPRDKLFPEQRIKSIFATETGSRKRIKALLELARAYELEGFTANAEAAFRRVATQSGAAPEDILQLVRFLYNKLFDYEDAGRFLAAIKKEVMALPANNDTRKSWARLDTLIRQRVPTINESIAKMESLAANGKDFKRFQAKVSGARREPTGGTTIPVVLTVLGAPRQVLALWVDGEDFSVFEVVGGGKAFNGVRVLDIQLEKGSKGGELLLWSLPGDSDVWPVVKRLKGQVLSRKKTNKRSDIMSLWSLQSRLRKALDTSSATPGAASLLRLTP
jgi:hypothetical protein